MQTYNNINEDCLFYYKVEENIDIYNACELVINVWCAVKNYRPTSINFTQGLLVGFDILGVIRSIIEKF